MRFVFILHRYMGILVGLLMAMWCLSGIVMMYVSYPSLDQADRLRGLAPLDWAACCTTANLPGLADDARIRTFQIEMMGGHPVMRLASDGGRRRLIDLTDGKAIASVTPEAAASVAAVFADGNGIAGTPNLLGMVTRDQWTVGGFAADRPLYHFTMTDPAGTELYVSGTAGRVVQITTSFARFWNWFGAVPHWLYPTMLRQDPMLWSQIVDWTSLIGCFLTLTGLYIGLRQVRWRKSTGRIASPYKGILFLHHIPGLIFGIFALTWIASGLVSMNPWGLWEGGDDATERQALQGAPPTWSEVRGTLAALPNARLNDATVSIDLAAYGGKLFLVATSANGLRTRLDARGAPAPLSDGDLAHIGDVLRGGDASATVGMIYDEDAYYFSHHADKAPLPVFRVVRNDATAWRYYVNPDSGALMGKIDGNAKVYRWMHQGLHRLDFTQTLRSRPLWDLVMLPLLLGVTFLCLIGAYLGLRSLLWKKSPNRVAW